MDVSSVSSYYYYLSSPFLRLSDAMIPLLCKPKSLTHVKIDLVVSPNRSISSSLHLQSSQNIPSLSCDSSTRTNDVLSFTIDDIITSCGLSDRFRVLFESSEKPNAVLKLLSDYGFSQTQVETMVSKYPRILNCSVEKTLKPKINFLRSVGLSETEFLGVVTTCPMLFTRSLKNHLVPIVEFLITSLGSRDNAVLVIKRYPFILFNTSKRLVPNLSTLRNLGIPQSQISNMMANVIGGRVITCTKPCRFSKVVSTAMEMGFDPSSLAFKNAVSAMLFCPGSTWEEKLVFYKTLGFSDLETLDIFREELAREKLLIVFSHGAAAAVFGFLVSMVSLAWIMLKMGVLHVPSSCNAII
ncbi:hypothetical protein RHSIM_Rhsim02G0087700 [Rhododendron simsii]|uniref:Uncharacterized protein n=1 Tax=Rhododendron simsii TaxID=118357 RepID=A0A834H8K2_RHOSS|nr:hypothetical protein RHSIM_Rhsim02G0087700 [Rhododendron simsii]